MAPVRNVSLGLSEALPEGPVRSPVAAPQINEGNLFTLPMRFESSAERRAEELNWGQEIERPETLSVSGLFGTAGRV